MTSPSSLRDVLVARCKVEGSLGVDDFHNTCLYHPRWGYYKTQPVLVRTEETGEGQGDFCTAPQLTSLFGEVWGAFCLAQWERWGQPSGLTLVELGPGLGTLMADLLRVGRLRPAFLKAVHVCLVDVHPGLRQAQQKALETFADQVASLTWHETLEEVALASGPLIVVANEFFDALACAQFQRTTSGWCERCIGVDAAGDFVWTLSEPLEDDVVKQCGLPNLYPLRAIAERSQAVKDHFLHVLRLLRQAGGAALVCDYGYTQPTVRHPSFAGDSWQALYRGKPVSPLAYPGLSDLSFHVDFGCLKQLSEAAGMQAHVTTQAAFLSDMGLLQRADQVQRHMDQAEQAALKASVNRLMDPQQMGTLFKVLTLEKAVA